MKKNLYINVLALFIYSCGYELGNNKQQQNIKTDISNETNISDDTIKSVCNLLDDSKYQISIGDNKNEKTNFYKKSENHENIQNVILNVIIPGFNERGYDRYSKILVSLCSENIKSTTTDYRTVVMYRWDVASQLSNDNLTYKNQYKILKAQFEKSIEKIRKEYSKDVNINVNFYGESYGGKICILFVNDILKEMKNDNRIKINNIYTLHSPLYTNMWAKFLLKNYFNATPEEKEEMECLMNLFGMNKCETTFKIMMDQYANYKCEIGKKMGKLSEKGIKINHIIGNPKYLKINIFRRLSEVFQFNTKNEYIAPLAKDLNIENLDINLSTEIEISKIPELLKILHNVFKTINNINDVINFLNNLDNPKIQNSLELKNIFKKPQTFAKLLKSYFNENDSQIKVFNGKIIPSLKYLIGKLIKDGVFCKVNDCVVSNEDVLGPDYKSDKNNSDCMISLPYGGQYFISKYLVHIGDFEKDKFEQEMKKLKIWN